MPDTLIDKYTRRFYEPEEFDFPPPTDTVVRF